MKTIYLESFEFETFEIETYEFKIFELETFVCDSGVNNKMGREGGVNMIEEILNLQQRGN